MEKTEVGLGLLDFLRVLETGAESFYAVDQWGVADARPHRITPRALVGDHLERRPGPG